MKKHGGDAISSRARSLARLHELITSMPPSGDVRPTLDALTQGIVEVTGFGVAAVSVVRPDGLGEVLSVAGDQRAVEILKGDTAPVRELLAEHLPSQQWGLFRFVAHEDFDPSDGPTYVPGRRARRRPRAWRPLDSLTATLTGVDGEPVGFLHVDAPPGGVRPDEETMRYLDIFAVQARTAVGAHLERVRLQDQVRLAQLGQRILTVATQTESIEDLISSYAELLRADFGATRVGVRLVESAADLPTGSWMSSDAERPELSPVLVEGMNAAALAAWRSQTPVVIGKDGSTPYVVGQVDRAELAAEMLERDVVAVLLAPIGAGADFFGYVTVARDEDWPAFSDAETQFAGQAARDLGTSLLNRQLLAREHDFTDHLRTLDENKRVLFSTIAHEFKGPIAAIAGHAELLEDGFDELADAAAGSISVASIARNARRLNDMVEDLMVLQEVEEPDLPEHREPVDLGVAVADAVDVWRLQAEIMDVQIEVRTPPGPVFAWGGRTEVGRVVINLVSNAVKYSSAGGTVHVELERRDDLVVFRCTDEGIGISVDDRAHLFDQFFRGSDAAVRRVAGTGLGLSIVRRIVEHLGGRIHVDSELGKGSSFTVELPAAPMGGGSDGAVGSEPTPN